MRKFSFLTPRNRGYRKFLLGYFLVLMLPLLILSLAGDRYFLAAYRDEILKQSVMSLGQFRNDLEENIDQFYAISGQISLQKSFRYQSAAMSPTTYWDIRSSLSGITSTHSFFESALYYNAGMPAVLHTDMGTYNPAFYREYLIDGEYGPISERLERIKAGTWLLPQETAPGRSGSFLPVLEYALPVFNNEGGFLVFSVTEQSLAELFTDDSVLSTIVYDEEGRQLYPFASVDSDLFEQVFHNRHAQNWLMSGREDLYQVNAYSESYGLYVTRVISKDVMLARVVELQQRFNIILALAIILCGTLVYFLAFVNYWPIHSLNELAREKVDVPDNMLGVDVARFALEQMNEKHMRFERQRAQEQLIIQLIHGRIKNAAHMEAECLRTQMDPSLSCMRVMILALCDEHSDTSYIMREVQELFADGFPCYGIEYPHRSSYLFLIGGNVRDGGQLQNKLLTVVERLKSLLDEPVRIAVGGVCNNYFQVRQSYHQALTVNQMDEKLFRCGVLLYDDIPRTSLHFVYPRMKLESLHEAIVSADLEKTNLVTDILIDIAHSQSHNSFVSTALCYDILNTYVRAQEELNLRIKSTTHLKISNSRLNAAIDVETFSIFIQEIRDETIRMISTDAKAASSQDVATMIVEYIDANYKDDNLFVSSVAQKFNMSISNLSHQFKASSGMNLSDYIAKKKLAYAKELLTTTTMNISDISSRLGYSQTASFIRKFKQYACMTPHEYRLLVKKQDDGNKDCC